jgi:hypothetical protein
MDAGTPGSLTVRVARRALIAGGAALALVAGAAAAASGDGADRPATRPSVELRFSRPAAIDNPFLPLARYRRCVLAGREGAARVRVVRRLLARTERFVVAGRSVQTAVIEDRAFEDGALVERTLDYFAQSDEGTVYYFGEDVDDYEGGRVVGHSGQWRYGRDTTTLGVAMLAHPRLGARWRFEDVPGITIESDEVVARIFRLRVRGRAYRDLIRVREFLEPERKVEYKLYARGVGVVRELPGDGRVELVGCER